MYFTARTAAARKEFRLDETLVENEGARFLFRRPVVIQGEAAGLFSAALPTRQDL